MEVKETEAASQIPTLYVLAPEAAKIAGIGEEPMREFLNDRYDPIPHLEIKSRKYIEVAAIAPYLRRKQIGSADGFGKSKR